MEERKDSIMLADEWYRQMLEIEDKQDMSFSPTIGLEAAKILVELMKVRADANK